MPGLRGEPCLVGFPLWDGSLFSVNRRYQCHQRFHPSLLWQGPPGEKVFGNSIRRNGGESSGHSSAAFHPPPQSACSTRRLCGIPAYSRPRRSRTFRRRRFFRSSQQAKNNTGQSGQSGNRADFTQGPAESTFDGLHRILLPPNRHKTISIALLTVPVPTPAFAHRKGLHHNRIAHQSPPGKATAFA